MAASRKKNTPSSEQNRIVYSEFGPTASSDALKRPVQELPPNQQNLRIQATRKGKGGKTVTVISGFQAKPDTLAQLLKQLKAQCGTGGTLKDTEIEIQGDHTEKLLQMLQNLGYKAKISGG